MKKLGNDTITLLVDSSTPDDKDELGIPVPKVDRVDQPDCSVQPATDTERESNTDVTIAKWHAYCPPTAALLAVKTSDSVEYLGEVYEVFGDPQPWTDRKGNAHHVTLILRKTRG